MSCRRVVVAASVLDDARCRNRLEAMLGRTSGPCPEIVDDDAFEQVLAALPPRRQLPRGGVAARRRDKDLVAFGLLHGEQVFPGYSWRELRSGTRERRSRHVLCQTGIEIQSVVGCPYDCTYCPYPSFVCVRLDVERFVDRVTALTRARRSQRLFKLNNRTDALAFEPEYGLVSALVARFAELDGPYLLLYEKGDRVDELCSTEHRGRTVASFTLTPEPVARMLEPSAPSPAARLAAISRLAAAGYPVRVRLSPIVPVRGWREAYGGLVSRIFEAARPELVTLWTLSMVDLDELGRIVPLEELDPGLLAQARAAAGAMRGEKGAPFPPEVRATIYRELASRVRDLSPSTKVALCLETPHVWDTLGSLVVPRLRGAFLCNCGPRSTPEAIRNSL